MRYPFELDPQIIHHIIYSQAGSIGKALIELIMNSVDARAGHVIIDITPDGFTCQDDGHGFASYEDVQRYFGRFGTPHQEGDATYGRFRLGRGQIMAHARTVWRSQQWQMSVDTRVMGYSYELDKLDHPVQGCVIAGEWYERLSSQERMSCIQEIRDLVRYTPITVQLNGTVISRHPENEKWDAEDEFAWYRIREEGAVSVYNQGVLVRHDPGHLWGVGGLIVSKQPIALNVSRTEILRKTCPVWKAIATKFGQLAATFSGTQGNHRKTESRREKSARALLAGDGDLLSLFHSEEVITLLPGKQHVTLEHFLRKCRYGRHAVDDGAFTIVRYPLSVPKGEMLARAGIATVVHPVTLTRFGCFEPEELMECLARIQGNIATYHAQLTSDDRGYWSWGGGWRAPLSLIDFATLSEAFVERTRMVSEKTLDAETRRAWTALRWCLANYAALCAGGTLRYRNGRVSDGVPFRILLGESTSADAWTDGETYIAYNIDIVRRLKTDALMTASRLFSLTEHEVAHQGDSMECGHDEAFYQRFHDISTGMAQERQRYMHIWLMKYTTSLEGEGKRAGGKHWRERWLTERASTGRQKKGLPGMTDDADIAKAIIEPVEPEDEQQLNWLNLQMENNSHTQISEPDWAAVIAEGLKRSQRLQAERDEEMRQMAEDIAAWYAEEHTASDEEDGYVLWMEETRTRLLETLPGATAESLTDSIVQFMMHGTDSAEEEQEAWRLRAWENPDIWVSQRMQDETEAHLTSMPADWLSLVKEGETRWMIERNAAAAGFMRETDYLRWRAEVEKSMPN
ncbi:ATP-binding protein [Enterobacter ludwigii]|uniref:ATP-binding protein n=1 Tax=Enterobacter ludwigii TaxID=299767 RepID=UPI00242E6DE8|nr:ATP-binding protein [Enterobacter ludwigii]WGC20711.1 ATP-binding protein [Enterobacter ludwigii]